MASHVLNSHAAAHPGPVATWWGDFKRQIHEIREQRRYRNRIRNELLAYSDRELADIGLTRADIPAVVGGTFRRP
jgi:uncharacterized protein YjiS (DUF1127 family)